MTVDPLLSLLVGALGAALLGLLGAWIQSRREHERWLREERLKAYAAFFQVVEQADIVDPKVEEAELRARLRELRVTHALVELLGPPAVAAAGTAYIEACDVLALTAEALPLFGPDDPMLAAAEGMTLANVEAAAAEVEVAAEEWQRAREALVLAAQRQLGIRPA